MRRSSPKADRRRASSRGDVTINGDLTVTGAKRGFEIDDPRAPSQRTLTHTPIETDSLQVTYSGNVTTDGSGRATVKLPSYATTLAGSWRYQPTPIGQFGQVIVSREVGGDGSFQVRSEHPRTKVSWSVIGLRKDPQARRDAITASTSKSGTAKGRYIDPSLYGKPASQAVTPGIRPTTTYGGARAAANRQARLRAVDDGTSSRWRPTASARRPPGRRDARKKKLSSR